MLKWIAKIIYLHQNVQQQQQTLDQNKRNSKRRTIEIREKSKL